MHGLVHGLAQAPEAPAVSCPPPLALAAGKEKKETAAWALRHRDLPASLA